ncbi:unnamed protein product, partial [Rotaria sp. Silwood1]
MVPWTSRVEIFEMIATAFCDAAKSNQAMSTEVIDSIINRLSGTNNKIHRTCAEALLSAMKNRHSFSANQMIQIEEQLQKATDTIVKQHLIELYALYVSKGHRLKLDLDSIEDDLLDEDTCETASYLFFKAATLEQRTFSESILNTLSQVAESKTYGIKARDNCLWALAYSIKQAAEKTSIPSEVIDTLGKLVRDPEKNVKQTAAIALCYYGMDESTVLSSEILEGLAEMLNETDHGLLNNILSVYLRLSKQDEEIPSGVLKKLGPLLYHDDFSIREKSIWILKHVVDNHQKIKLKIIDQIDGCYNDAEFRIRNTAALIFISYWKERIDQNDKKLLRILSIRMEQFISTVFRLAFSLDVQQSSLDLLQLFVAKDFILSETLIHLIECCLYDGEVSISSKSIGVLQIYLKKHPLPPTTFVCLEHLLTRETPIMNEVISILKSLVMTGERLSKKAIDMLAQLLFKTSQPNEITKLLTHADRNQPLPKSIDELLRQIYYGKILQYSRCPASLNKAIKELLYSTSQGRSLCTSVLDLLLRKLESDQEQRSALMPILVNVVANGQSLNKDEHLSILGKIFFEQIGQPSIDLIQIFTHLTRQNQIIADEIIAQLYDNVTDPSMNHFIIEIYQYLIERQKPLEASIISQIFQLFFEEHRWRTLYPDLQYRLALFYKAVADNRSKEINQTSLSFLLRSDQSFNVRKEICTALRLLIGHGEELHRKTIDILINFIDNDDDADLQTISFEILNRVRSTDRNISKYLDVFQCNDQTDDRVLLKQLKEAMNIGMKLPEPLIIRLSHMLYSCDLQVKTDAAMILASRMSKGKTLSPRVLSIISMTLRDETINMKTLQLLFDNRSEQPLPMAVIDDLLYLATRSSKEPVQQCVQEILATQMKNNRTKVEFFFDYLNTKKDQSYGNDVRRILKIFRGMIIIEKRIMDELFVLVMEHFVSKDQDEILDLFLLAHQHNIPFDQHLALMRSIEMALPKDPKAKLIELMGILIDQGAMIEDKTQQILFEIFVEKNDESTLKVLERVAQHRRLPEEMLLFFVQCLSDPSKEMFVTLTFSIIRHQILQGFIGNPMEIIEKIQFPSFIDLSRLIAFDSMEKCLNTIQTLLFVNYFQPDVFEQPIEQWSRNCLSIEILTNCGPDITTESIISFYQYLTLWEQFKHYKIFDDQRDLFLRHFIEKQRRETLTLPIINDVLIYAKTSSDTLVMILSSNQLDWFTKLRLNYIESQLVESFKDLQYSKSLIDHLVQRLGDEEQLTAVCLDVCLPTIRTADDILTLLNLFTSYALTKDEFMEIFFHGTTPTDFSTLQKKIEVFILGKTLKSHWIGSNENFSRVRTLLQTLIQRGWTVPKLLLILTIKGPTKTSEELLYLIDILKILVDYNVDSNLFPHLESIRSENELRACSVLIYNRVIEHCFGSTSSEKNLSTLLSELDESNQQINKKELLKKYKAIESNYSSDSTVFPQKKPIESWSKSMIQRWAKHVRSKPATVLEMIAVIKRAIFLDSNFEPRPIQILAILILLDRKDQGGRLLQILTGEGKSTVVSILAVIKALQNQHVDIITSSITLAKRDAHERKEFYDYFNVTVAHNNDETSYSSGPKLCYQADIVYGNSSQFQFDLLRHEFSLLNTRTLDKDKGLTRRFDAVIIDEVDSMLIDENNTLARLADQLPGMEWLNPVLYGIWRCIDSEKEPSVKRDQIIDNMRKFVTDPKSDLKLPQHLKRFIDESIPIWIDHAILAKVEYRLDHHYMIKSDEARTKRIMPIDFSNTGVVQSCTTWSDGLHQFLQIKHGLKMTALTVTTNYLSNIGLFIRYGKNIFGLTGTIGSKDTQNLLDQIYHVDTIIIPPFKQKRYIQLKPILTANDDQWLKTIVSETISNARHQRGILVICETRLDAKTISKQIQRADPTLLVRLYTDNTDAVESNVVGNRIQSGEIIVATNLAGRGTDLKTSPNVEKNGGLHVCLTYLPNNLRVEDQAFGRTSRQGQRGTSQMILSSQRTFEQLTSIHPEYSITNPRKTFTHAMEIICDWRQQAERIHLERMWKDEIVEIKLKDQLFQRFCQLLDKLRQQNDNVYRLLSVKEQWGFWLKSMDYVTQNRRNLRLYLEKLGFIPEDVPADGHSFFHALSKQINGELTADEIKNQVIEHMINHSDTYQMITEEERHQATCEALKINLIIYRTDSRSPHIYEREDAIHTCTLGYEVDSYYFSLRSNQSDDAAAKTKQEKSRREQLFKQFKKFVDRAKKQKETLNEQLATKIIDHDLNNGFTIFENEMKKNYEKEDFIRNPCYLLMDAETAIKQLTTWSNSARSWIEVLPGTDKRAVTYKDAVDRLEKAIKLDPIFTFAAQVNLAHFLIDKEQSTPLYKIKAKSYLNQAQEILGKYILPQLYSMQMETEKKNDEELIYDDFINQIKLKMSILQLYQSHVSQAITIIEDSQKLIDITVTDGDNPGRIRLGKKLYRDEVTTFLNQAHGEIDLTFHSLKCHTDLWKHDQALKLLEILSKKDQHVSIYFLDGSMKKIEELESIITSEKIQLNIEYLDSDELEPLMELGSKIDLKLTATTKDYLAVLKTIHEHVESNEKSYQTRKETSKIRSDRRIIEMNDHIELITDTHRLVLTADDALKTLQDESITVESILFKSICKEHVHFILSHVTQPSFTLIFHSLTIDRLKNIVKDVTKPFNYKFRHLSTSQAKTLIEKTSDRDFLLLIQHLSVNRAKKIIKKFDLNEQDVKSSLKQLSENFSKTDQQYEELNAYGLLGVSLLINVDELTPRPWISVTIVVVSGVLQIAGGVYLTAVTCGLGITFGISLIGEGINDIIFGIRGALSRRFSWKDYAIQKGISLGICFATLGFSAVSQAYKGVQAVGLAGASSTISATRQGVVAIFKNSFRTVGSGALKGVSSSSWLLALTQVGITCAETGVRELANYFSDAAYQGLLSQVKSLIREEIESIVRTNQSNEHYQRIFNRALAVDRYYNKDEWRKELERIAMDILTKNKDQFLETVQSLSKGITNAFLNHSRQFLRETGGKNNYGGYVKTAQLLLTIGPMLKGAQEIRTLTDSFYTQYMAQLKILEEKIPTFEDLLAHALNQEISSSSTRRIVKSLIKHSILTSEGLLHSQFNQDNDEEPDLSNVASFLQTSDGPTRTPKEKLRHRLKKLKFKKDEHRISTETVLMKIVGSENHSSLRVSIFQKKIVTILVDQVCAILYGTMVTPLKNFVISQAIAAMSTAIQLKINPDGTVMEQLMEQGAQRYIHGVANDLIDKYNRGELKVDPQAKEKLDKLLEESQTTSDQPKTLNENLALNVVNGKQGGIIELAVLAMLTKKPITVLKEQSDGQANADDGSIQMVYTPPTTDKTTGKTIDGHYELAGGTTAQGGPNDCLYTTILSKAQDQFSSVSEMRMQCAAFILTNPSFISGIHPAL